MNAHVLNGIPSEPASGHIPGMLGFGDTASDPSGGASNEKPGRSVVVTGPPIPKPSWDISQAVQFWDASEKLQKQGRQNGMNINPASLLAAAGTGAALGAAAGGIGAPIGAAVAVLIVLVTQFTSGPADPYQDMWDNAGNGVHAWFTHFGPVEFLDWCKANNPGALASVTDVNRTLCMWWVERYGTVLVPGMKFYSGKPDNAYLNLLRPYSFGAGYGSSYDSTILGELMNPSAAGVAQGLEWYKQELWNLGIDYEASAEMRRNGERGLAMVNRRTLEPPELAVNLSAAEQAQTTTAALGVAAAAAALTFLNKA